ncbi:MAG: GntR family transcriptional regulator [Muribaculaceae bacterium]|nr:GntR family transcriptional regulator [Muribaculaceae bacterium]
MDFNNTKPIYRQIIDYALARVINGQWTPGARIPSVREMAVALAVNSHTVLKAFEFLEDCSMIYPRRGMGYYMADNALEIAQKIKRDEFYRTTLTETFASMEQLGIDISEVTDAYLQWRRNQSDANPSITDTGSDDLNT